MVLSRLPLSLRICKAIGGIFVTLATWSLVFCAAPFERHSSKSHRVSRNASRFMLMDLDDSRELTKAELTQALKKWHVRRGQSG